MCLKIKKTESFISISKNLNNRVKDRHKIGNNSFMKLLINKS